MPRTRRRGARTARGTPFPLHLSRVGRVYLRERQGSTPRAPTKSSRTAATALAPAPEAVRAITAHRRALLAHPATPRVRVSPVSICLCVCLSCARRRQCGAPGATGGTDSTSRSAIVSSSCGGKIQKDQLPEGAPPSCPGQGQAFLAVSPRVPCGSARCGCAPRGPRSFSWPVFLG